MRLLRDLLAAVVVGVATLFQPKAEPDRHWSIPPTWPVDEQHPGQANAGRRR